MVVQLMESQAYRELAAAHMFGYGLRFVPDKWIKFMVWHIHEETEHYQAVAQMYREFTGEEVEPQGARAAGRQAGALRGELDGAGHGPVPLRPRRLLAAQGVRRVLVRALPRRDPEDRQGGGGPPGPGREDRGRAVPVRPATTTSSSRSSRSGCAWACSPSAARARPATASPSSTGSRSATPATACRTSSTTSGPAVRAAGLRFPDPASLKMELPPDIDWS